MKLLRFDDGDAMPALGLGTWKSEPDEVYHAVKEALRVGYRHVDCAAIYGNESEVGRALEESFEVGVVDREDVWITSKLWNDRHAREEVRPALEETLADLRLNALDLYLVHWPIAFEKGVTFPRSVDEILSLDERPLEETWAGMRDVKEAGLARHVGVSNFSVPKLKRLGGGSADGPEVNQIELHPYLQQPGMLEYCGDAGIVVTAYSPLGSRDRPERLKEDDEPVLMEDPVIRDVAEERGATPAQVLIAWALERGTSVIPKSVNPGRIRENLEAADLALTDEDMERIAELDRHRRYIDGSTFAEPEGSPYTVEGLWDE